MLFSFFFSIYHTQFNPSNESCFRGGMADKVCIGSQCPPCWIKSEDKWGCYDELPDAGCTIWPNMIDIRTLLIHSTSNSSIQNNYESLINGTYQYKNIELFNETIQNGKHDEKDLNKYDQLDEKNLNEYDQLHEETITQSAEQHQKNKTIITKDEIFDKNKNLQDGQLHHHKKFKKQKLLLGLPQLLTSNFKGPCGLPLDSNIIEITPHKKNKGWAMSPDQQCLPGQWCPYACKSGMYSTQWDPNTKCTNGPECGSMNGGLFCTNDGLIIPKPEEPFCKLGVQNVIIKNTLKSSVSLCQTVYPGNEAMIIPTQVNGGEEKFINVSPNSYWHGTSSDFYVNMVNSDDKHCIWGNEKYPVGNWAPYLIGAGESKDGNTYLSLRANPLFKQQKFSKNGLYNVNIECEGDYCFGLPCKFIVKDGFKNRDCTVTIGKDSKAIVKFEESETTYKRKTFSIGNLLNSLI